MAAESLFEAWNNIPGGSTLHVTLTPKTGFGVTGTHTVQTANGPVLSGAITAEHFQLQIPIGAGDRHVVDFTLLSTGAQVDVQVVARVEEPDGSTFQHPAEATAELNDNRKAFLVNLFANG